MEAELHSNSKFIDIEKVISGKNPNLLKILPRFVIKYLKRILHQDRLNGILERHKNKEGIEFLDAVLSEFNVNIQVKGAPNFNSGKNYVIVSNHPLGGLDGMALMLVMGRMNPEIAMTANDFLMHIDNLKVLFVPVNKHGSNAENIENINRVFESDKVILFFPAGLCSRKISGQIIDLEWKKTFLSQARKYNRDILPVHISGKNSNFFYNLARLRKKMGIKANIEMLYLVDEMFKQDNKDLIITFGKPISVSTFTKNIKDKEWASKIREHVYKLEENPDADFISMNF